LALDSYLTNVQGKKIVYTSLTLCGINVWISICAVSNVVSRYLEKKKKKKSVKIKIMSSFTKALIFSV
jgi:hypothetical protein